ncbi:hypothetical protein PHMEG_00026970 [Phytophthora megakarya]|uniref:Uncharacterized protein n=1 Tax=Phytophthora megakarya TaxID=4795 RepID=A0A225V9Q6_9STRA|nr:hypothetical protein PHMEG_00026970 [Phytophthora megakarya]
MLIQFNLGVDSQSALAPAARPTYSRLTRHIELRYHYVRDQVIKENVQLAWDGTPHSSNQT